MTNAEYYKNYSFDEVRDKFVAACPDKSKQTVQAFNEWCKAEHYQLILGDAVLREFNRSTVEIVVSVNAYTPELTLRPIANYLSNDSSLDTVVNITNLKLFTGKALFNVNALSKDSTKQYHFAAAPTCPCIKTSKSSESAHMSQANKSKKDKILDYMEKVMLINSDDIDRLRMQSVKEIYTHTFHNVAYIFSVLYRVSPSKDSRLTDEFIYACHNLAPKWLAVRKKCNCFKCITDYELIAMLDRGAVGYTGNNFRMYNINGELV